MRSQFDACEKVSAEKHQADRDGRQHADVGCRVEIGNAPERAPQAVDAVGKRIDPRNHLQEPRRVRSGNKAPERKNVGMTRKFITS